MASVWMVNLHASSSIHLRISPEALRFRSEVGLNYIYYTNWGRKVKSRKFVVRALNSDDGRRLMNDADVAEKLEKVSAEKSRQNPLTKLRESIGSIPLFVSSTRKFEFAGTDLAIGLCIVATILVVAVRSYLARKSRYSHQGSVADLVRRGQLRSDRRGISTPLKYEDPFNNPMVKVSKSNSTVEMCGKVYRLAPVTLTKEQQSIHQRRRSRAYQWKRPTMFLKEGESVPPDVDPDTIRWIPANHPFATTASDIEEDLAQNNVYQKHGVPFRIQAEHEALQKKLEALQNEQKLNKLVIDPAAARDFERPLKSFMKSENQVEQNTSNAKVSSNPPISDRNHNSPANKPSSEEIPNT